MPGAARTFIGLAALAALGLATSSADAKCRIVTDCRSGACIPLEECDSALDRPVAPPPGSPPVPRSLTPEPGPGARGGGPVGPRLMPPPGTSQCRPTYVCVAGRCQWESVCN